MKKQDTRRTTKRQHRWYTGVGETGRRHGNFSANSGEEKFEKAVGIKLNHG